MHPRIIRTCASLLAAAGLLAATAANAHNVVINGGFETGNFSGWTTGGDQSFNGVDSFAPHSGSFAAFFGTVSSVSTLSQTVATRVGEAYDVIFWLANEADVFGATVPNSFSFSWGGVPVLTLTNSAAFGYTKFEFNLKATSTSTTLLFGFDQNPAFFDLDDVAVIPEPSSFALAGLAFGLVAVQRRRRHFSA